MLKLLIYLMLQLLLLQLTKNKEFSLTGNAWFESQESYLEYNITDEMQNQDSQQLEVILSIKTSVGTLIYTFDKDQMQFVVNLSDDNNDEIPEIEIIYGGTAKMKHQLRDICGCKWTCLYDKLTLTFQWGKYFSVQCNNGKVYRNSAPKTLTVDADSYPFVKLDRNKNLAAVLWMVNFPSKYGVKSKIDRIRGCIFSVKYNNKEIDMVPYGKFKKGECGKSCKKYPKVCNGGGCVETYNYLPKCDCSTTLMNGYYCNKTVDRVDREYNNKINTNHLKISWRNKNKNKTLIKMEGRNIAAQIYIMNLELHLALLIRNTKFDIALPTINRMKEEHILFIGIINKNMYIEFPKQNHKCAPCINVDQDNFTFTRSVIYGSGEFIDVAFRDEHNFKWRDPFLHYKYKVLNKTTASTSRGGYLHVGVRKGEKLRPTGREPATAATTTVTMNASNVDNYKYTTLTAQFGSIDQYFTEIQKNQYIFIVLLIIVLIFVIGRFCIGIIVYLKSNNKNVKRTENSKSGTFPTEESESKTFLAESVAKSLNKKALYNA